METVQSIEAVREPAQHEFSASNAEQGLPADFMCGCPKGDLLGPCEHAAAEHESVVTHTIGIEMADAAATAAYGALIAIVERDEHGYTLGEAIDEYGLFDSDGEAVHPLAVLAEAISDMFAYVDDADESTPIVVEPLSGAVLAALGQPLYTAPLQLEAEVVGAPTGGPCWQIIDASDESTWHDLTAVTRCEKPGCEVRRDCINGCTVLVSSAYRDGYAHVASYELVSVRIPAGAA